MKSIASILPGLPEKVGQPELKRGVLRSTWEKYGLLSPGFFRSYTGDPGHAALSRPGRFRLALEESGGLFAIFGLFLSGRADLLASPYLLQLRDLSAHRRPSALPAIERYYQGRLSGFQLVRVAPASEVYSAAAAGGRVTVEVYSPETLPLDDRSWAHFESEIAFLCDTEDAPVIRRAVLEHYREWLLLHSDIERKRTILGNLAQVPEGCVSRFPRLAPELQSETCLVYEAMEGEGPTDGEAGTVASASHLQLVTEGFLEQSLLLSLVDAEALLRNNLVLGDKRLGFRAVPAFAPVYVEWSHELLQYVASAVAHNSPRALHNLARICASTDTYAREQRLMRELSGLQPELKINVVTPPTATTVENYWRALASAKMEPPLFLELFHRRLVLLGQQNGAVAPDKDLIAESLWPVLGRILRFRFSELLSAEKGREWLAGSSLFLLTAMRQTAMTLEQIRDNDLALVTDHQTYQPRGGSQDHRVMDLIRSGIALAIFLGFLQLALGSDGISRVVGVVGSLATGLALAVFLARIR